MALGGAMMALAILGVPTGSSSKEPAPPAEPSVKRTALPKTWLFALGAGLVVVGVAFSPLVTMPYARRKVRLLGRRRRRRARRERRTTWPLPPPPPAPPAEPGPPGEESGPSEGAPGSRP